jgi:hypothetical protein
MGKILTPEVLRIRRARNMNPDSVSEVSENRFGGWDACVTGTHKYDVHVELDDGKLTRCSCTCPDYTGMKDLHAWCWENLDHDELANALRGIPQIRGIVFCKHVARLILNLTG